MLHVAAIPDDFINLGLHALERVGQLRDQIRPAPGKGVAQGGAAALQAIELGPGSTQG
ncbi:hypothetical protein D3C75_1282080 [compost metagenome]